jgi:hypothetical protein
MSNWQAVTPYGTPTPGVPVQSGAGGYTSYGVAARDNLDAMRIGGRTPEAEYPDGYLGTIRSRREDRLLDAVKSKIGDRSYQRGVHKGAQIDGQDYFWPQEFDDQMGIRRQSTARRQGYTYNSPRFAPLQTTTEQIMYGQGMPRGAQSLLGTAPGEISEQAPQLAKYLPGWR